MYQKMKAYVAKHHMLEKMDKVIVGVSGGADSICLLFMLLELKKEIGFSLEAVHVHHGLRGESADKDAAYVEKICEDQGIVLHVFYENVKEFACTHGYSEEEAGRVLRRNAFLSTMEKTGGTKIALAHHKNDNVETVLWNLCRGTGLKGLGGIRPVAGAFIRPLLCLTRKEIETYLENADIYYCTDETNGENLYTRNRIRNQIIPYLEEQVNAQSSEHIAEAIEHLRLLNEYVEKEVETFKKVAVQKKEGGCLLYKKEYDAMPEVFQKQLLHLYLEEAAGESKDIEAVHIKMLADLLENQVGRKCDLPYGLEARRVYEGIMLLEKIEKAAGYNKPKVEIRVFERTPEMVTFPEKTYTKWFDYDIIKSTFDIRHRESGDYIVIDKNGKTQKLKQYFVNAKIPQDKRDQIWLLADGKEIIWIVGYRQSQAYQVTEKTVQIMEVSFVGEDIEQS